MFSRNSFWRYMHRDRKNRLRSGEIVKTDKERKAKASVLPDT